MRRNDQQSRIDLTIACMDRHNISYNIYRHLFDDGGLIMEFDAAILRRARDRLDEQLSVTIPVHEIPANPKKKFYGGAYLDISSTLRQIVNMYDISRAMAVSINIDGRPSKNGGLGGLVQVTFLVAGVPGAFVVGSLGCEEEFGALAVGLAGISEDCQRLAETGLGMGAEKGDIGIEFLICSDWKCICAINGFLRLKNPYFCYIGCQGDMKHICNNVHFLYSCRFLVDDIIDEDHPQWNSRPRGAPFRWLAASWWIPDVCHANLRSGEWLLAKFSILSGHFCPGQYHKLFPEAVRAAGVPFSFVRDKSGKLKFPRMSWTHMNKVYDAWSNPEIIKNIFKKEDIDLVSSICQAESAIQRALVTKEFLHLRPDSTIQSTDELHEVICRTEIKIAKRWEKRNNYGHLRLHFGLVRRRLAIQLANTWPCFTNARWDPGNMAWMRAERPEAMQQAVEASMNKRLSAIERRSPHMHIVVFLRRRTFCPVELQRLERLLTCDYCGQTFQRAAGLTRHRKSAHKAQDGDVVINLVDVVDIRDAVAIDQAGDAEWGGELSGESELADEVDLEEPEV
jgi:hypothetical protein